MLNLDYINFIHSSYSKNIISITTEPGLHYYITYKLFSRLEKKNNYTIKDLPTSNHYATYYLITKIIPNSLNFNNRIIANIFLLDICTSYRGWRHATGLPTRGQRTWTNAWTAYRNNLILRKFKTKVAKKLYGAYPLEFINMAYLAEQINAYWKVQWQNEWREAKKKRLIYLQKKNSMLKIDLKAMSKKNIWGYKKKIRKQKKKTEIKKTIFALGFDPGFVKSIIKLNLQQKVLITSNLEKKIRKPKKKKIIKKKIIKKKKSVWD